MKSTFENPLKLAGMVVGITLVGFWLVVALPFWDLGLHASHANAHAPEDPLVMKGHEVYYESGCQSCHTQNIRPFKAEMLRFADMEKFGNAFAPSEQDTAFFTPSAMGSRRIGPDLAAAASKHTRESLVELLTPKESDTARKGYHNYAALFAGADAGQDMEARRMSWKIRWMMNTGTPFSDPYQRGVFDRLEGSTRGDALVEYILFLGQRNLANEAQFYK